MNGHPVYVECIPFPRITGNMLEYSEAACLNIKNNPKFKGQDIAVIGFS